MPWKECNPMDERLEFVARLLDGEKMAVVCREFGISRKTGCRIIDAILISASVPRAAELPVSNVVR